ncbi:MAG: NifB/NifX family molybdenum-iron cluster-binding protein [Planctomycetota bacterium]
MKIAVTATGPTLEAAVDPRFGRCQFFVIVETDDMSIEAVRNENVMAGGGAGIQSAKLVAEKGAQIVLTGNCGPNAFSALQAADIPVCVGVGGTVKEAVEAYQTGQIAPTGNANVQSHFGTGDRQ